MCDSKLCSVCRKVLIILITVVAPLGMNGCAGWFDWSLSPVDNINISIPLGLGGDVGLFNPDGGSLDFFNFSDDAAGDNVPPIGGFESVE